MEVQIPLSGIPVLLQRHRGHAEPAIVPPNHLPHATVRLGLGQVVLQPGVEIEGLAHVEDRQLALGGEDRQLVDPGGRRGMDLDVGPGQGQVRMPR